MNGGEQIISVEKAIIPSGATRFSPFLYSFFVSKWRAKSLTLNSVLANDKLALWPKPPKLRLALFPYGNLSAPHKAAVLFNGPPPVTDTGWGRKASVVAISILAKRTV